ncbi:MAG: DEAD/DEAH box helicase [Acidobacteria bacterium]|nr:DEAD/DEAH box helicase [Acidobacteriota bacterium]
MADTSKKTGRLRQIRVVAIRPRGTPREEPPPPPVRAAGTELSAFPEVPVPFSTLDLPAPILASLEAMGYRQATDVQARSIPLARAGRDLIVESRTGTGKTTAFGIPIIEKVDPARPQVQALVLCPARELSIQVSEELGRLGQHSGVRALTIYGGDAMSRQLDGLRRGAHVVVGTPGRILDHLRQGTLRLDAVRFLVLDEADRMLDMGFEKEVRQILDQVPKDRQTLMFSATIPSAIEAMASRYQREPERLMLSQDALYVTDVQHLFCILSRMDKAAALYRLIEYESPASSMIFCNTRVETRLVHSYLALRGLPVAMISSDLPQRKREQVMRRFKSKALRHLVATDVAARGIDIEDLSHVFIYSTPDSSDQYIHRAGRTGRIGKTGRVISLVSAFDLMNFNRLVRANHLKAYEIDVPSDEEVARRKVRRIVDTLKEMAAKLSPEDRAEYEAMAQGILDDAERLAIVGYLLKTHFEEEAARGVLDEGVAAAEEEAGGPGGSGGYAPARHGAHHVSHGGHGSGGHGGPGQGSGPAGQPGSGRRRRRRRRRGGGGGTGGGSGGGHGHPGGGA